MSRPSRIRSNQLDPVQLIDFTRFYAAEVRSGAYPYVDYDAEARWHQRIYRDRRIDVWLISWLPTQGTQLHDHGGSSGAFTVISGELAEAVHSDGRLRDHTHQAGTSVGFGPQYVHDVRNLSDAPAVSLHAYSRPLSSMRYYDLDGGVLVPLISLDTDDPEPSAGELRLAS
ncbi:MAG: hypothetical protein QOG80_2980 [Pseudonocardiales bacterium]|nr:hypothetical protein [Pseudonocardiales bacterium]